jgi:hypothetical protein
MEDHDLELMVFHGDNGDWYVSIVETHKKLGPCVRITTSGSPRGQHMVAPTIANLYRTLGGEEPTFTIPREDDEVAQLRARVTELEESLVDAHRMVQTAEVEADRARANEETWRRDAVEDRPAREVLKAVREMLGCKEGEGVVDAVAKLAKTIAEFKDIHVNMRAWMARAEKLAAK